MERATAYDEDFFAWSEHQAAVLRSLPARGVALPNDLDLEHLVEEVEDLGRSELNGVASHLKGMLVHLCKAMSDAPPERIQHWLIEVDQHHSDVLFRATNAMRHRLDLPLIWRRSVHEAETVLQKSGSGLPPMPEDCPFGLEELLAERLDSNALLAKLRAALPATP